MLVIALPVAAASAAAASWGIAGGYLGARMAVARGSGFVRVVFLVVVSGLILRLGWDVLTS